MNDDYDFFDTPIIPYTLLAEGVEITLHVRHSETMEQKSVRGTVARKAAALPEEGTHRLHVYGRLGEHISSDWFIHVTEELDEAALATDHELAQSLDMEQSLKSAEKFKESRYRQPKGR
ncbi:MAG: hypothetical protein IT495_19235 [Gammaproteobacteria bacterium]|nr:hypothetical protein [Gammaproteobacteria bacterium]